MFENIKDLATIDAMIQIISLLIVLWSLIGIYKDAVMKRPYDWLMTHYIGNDSLREKANDDTLRFIKTADGCSKFTFRRKVMRPIMERN
jgi:hypothetical protein